MPGQALSHVKVPFHKATVISIAFMTSACAHSLSCDGPQPALDLAAVYGDVAAPLRTADDRADLLLQQDGSIENLSCWASRGDKVAQYTMGRAYERGEAGLTVDRKKAIRYYRQAAQAISNQTYVYSPPVGKESYGRVIPITIGAPSPGLPEAIEALKRLEAER